MKLVRKKLRKRNFLFILAMALTASLYGETALAAKVKFAAKYAHPDQVLHVRGIEFGANQTVDVYFDAEEEAAAVTNATGRFSVVGVTVPIGAVPGTHWISVVERDNGLTAQRPVIVTTDWTQIGFTPRQERNNVYENVLGPNNVSQLQNVWTAPIAGVESSPTVADQVVYVSVAQDAASGGGALYALDQNTGSELWSVAMDPGENSTFSSPAVANGLVYVADKEAKVYAFDAATGAKVWDIKAPTGEIDASPTVQEGAVYVCSLGSQLVALDALTGALRWSVASSGGCIFGSPAVVDGVVYIGGTALDAATGTTLWSTGASGSPTVVNKTVYICAEALDAKSGTVKWSVSIECDARSSPAFASGILYLSSYDGHLYALNSKTGKTLWSAPTAANTRSSPAVANGVVYVGSFDDHIYAFDAKDGSLLWSTQTLGSMFSSPTVADGMLFAAPAGTDGVRAYAIGDPDRAVPRDQPAAAHFVLEA